MVNAMFVILHESTHYQINKYHKVESKVVYGFLGLKANTISTDTSNKIYPEMYILAHSITEAVGYHLWLPTMLLTFILIIVYINLMYQLKIIRILER